MPSYSKTRTISMNVGSTSDPNLAKVYLTESLASLEGGLITGVPYTSPISWTFNSDGSKVIYAQVEDLAGNKSAVISGVIIIDTVLPQISGIYPTDGGICSSNFFISGYIYDNTSLVNSSKIKLLVDGIDYSSYLTKFSNGSYITGFKAINGISNIADGYHQVLVTAEDYAGNLVKKDFSFELLSGFPSVPTNLAVNGVYNGGVLQWDKDNSVNLSHYDIQFRSGTGVNIVSDSFNRADSISSAGDADTGQTWVNAIGLLGIKDNQVYNPTKLNGGTIRIDAGETDYIFEAKLSSIPKGSQAEVSFRAGTDINGIYLLAVPSSNVYYIQYYYGGSQLWFDTIYQAPKNGDILRVNCIGTGVDFYINDNFVYTATDNLLGANTYCGLGIYDAIISGGARFDDVNINMAGSPTWGNVYSYGETQILEGTTQAKTNFFVHSKLESDLTTKSGVNICYRVRSVNKAGATSNFCSPVCSRSTIIDSGDIAANSIYANHIKAGEINTKLLQTNELTADTIQAGNLNANLVNITGILNVNELYVDQFRALATMDLDTELVMGPQIDQFGSLSSLAASPSTVKMNFLNQDIRNTYSSYSTFAHWDYGYGIDPDSTKVRYVGIKGSSPAITGIQLTGYLGSYSFNHSDIDISRTFSYLSDATTVYDNTIDRLLVAFRSGISPDKSVGWRCYETKFICMSGTSLVTQIDITSGVYFSSGFKDTVQGYSEGAPLLRCPYIYDSSNNYDYSLDDNHFVIFEDTYGVSASYQEFKIQAINKSGIPYHDTPFTFNPANYFDSIHAFDYCIDNNPVGDDIYINLFYLGTHLDGSSVIRTLNRDRFKYSASTKQYIPINSGNLNPVYDNSDVLFGKQNMNVGFGGEDIKCFIDKYNIIHLFIKQNLGIDFAGDIAALGDGIYYSQVSTDGKVYLPITPIYKTPFNFGTWSFCYIPTSDQVVSIYEVSSDTNYAQGIYGRQHLFKTLISGSLENIIQSMSK